MVHALAVLALTGSLFERHELGQHPRPTESESILTRAAYESHVHSLFEKERYKEQLGGDIQ